jgi:hypothetical protein
MRIGWELPADVFRRGDKIMATADLYNEHGQTIGGTNDAKMVIFRQNLLPYVEPPLDFHPFSPYFSSDFIIPANEPQGAYAIVSEATKTGYMNALGGRWFVVDDQAFTMTATPKTQIADGESTITVQSEIINEGGNPIPNGTLMTVIPWGGTIATADADPVAPWNQVTSSGGRVTFLWRAPTDTFLDAFMYGTLGDTRPKGGVSAVFKGIDYNSNKRVDIDDILDVQVSEGGLLGADNYQYLMDLNGDDLVNQTDKHQVRDRWSLELPGAVHSVTQTMPIGTHGIVIRPVPQVATIPPGGVLDIMIVGEGLDNLGGYEFVASLQGSAFSMTAPPSIGNLLSTTANTQTNLGPIPYENGYRVGGYASGDNPGPSGNQVLATLSIHADALGESELILTQFLASRMDATEMSLMQVWNGLYTSGVIPSTPTPTPTTKPTSTQTPLPPTPTPTVKPQTGDTNGDGNVDWNDILYFSRNWHRNPGEADPNCNPVEDDAINPKDLLFFMKAWGEK